MTRKKTMRALFPALNILPATQRDVTFITTQELEDQYPEWTPKEREDAFVKDHPTTFLMQIGGALRSVSLMTAVLRTMTTGHSTAICCFGIILLQRSYEVSSMGIRVNAESMDRQLSLAGCDARRTLPFHKALLSGSCPILWAAVSASPACVCCCWAALTSAKCSPPSGMRRLGVSAQSAV